MSFLLFVIKAVMAERSKMHKDPKCPSDPKCKWGMAAT